MFTISSSSSSLLSTRSLDFAIMRFTTEVLVNFYFSPTLEIFLNDFASSGELGS